MSGSYILPAAGPADRWAGRKSREKLIQFSYLAGMLLIRCTLVAIHVKPDKLLNSESDGAGNEGKQKAAPKARIYLFRGMRL